MLAQRGYKIMSYLQAFHNTLGDGKISISAEQGSRFAKQIAGDFNPIHDPDSKRFCVPGDLLFALALDNVGLHESMTFRFLDLVSADASLSYPNALHEHTTHVTNVRGKPALGIDGHGATLRDKASIEQLVLNYVAFSGQNFPHILLPLLEKGNVMVNPKRPLVIYESMSFTLSELAFSALRLELDDTTLNVNGKRGKAALHFSFYDGENRIGSGLKSLLLSGLREYDEKAVNALIDEYQANKEAGIKQFTSGD